MTRRTNVVFTLGLASLIVSIAEPTAFA